MTYPSPRFSNVSWLVTTPATDVNFLGALKRASLEELEEALAQVTAKTKAQRIRAQINRLRKERRGR